MDPRRIATEIEAAPVLPVGQGDRFAGYAVVGLPFRSGHVLALRRFPASSIGPGYTSVWHRDARGLWTFYSTIPPDLGCARYFGGEVTYNVVSPIGIEWTSSSEFSVRVGTVLKWDVSLRSSLESRLTNAVARLMPKEWWHNRSVLKAMGVAARFALAAGGINLFGRTPNGYEFIANPWRVWLIDSSRASLNGKDLGKAGALVQQARLSDVWIPQRGIFTVARVFFKK